MTEPRSRRTTAGLALERRSPSDGEWAATVDAEDGPGAPSRSRRSADTQAVLAGICPYLLSEDGAWRAARAMREHRCTAVRPPALLPLDKQRRLCLLDVHTSCPAYEAAQERHAAELASAGISLQALAARQTRPLARTVPVALDRPTAVPGPAGLVAAYRRLGRVGLAALMLLALGVLILARLPGNPSAAVAPTVEPTATPAAAAVATASPPPPSPTPPRTQTRTATPRPTPAPTPTPVPFRTYRVQSGDTLAEIAERHGTTVAAIRRANNLESGSFLRTGQVLRIPPQTGPTPTPRRTYVVRPGDSLASIAERFDTTVEAIRELNDLRSRRLIRPGQVLLIP